MANGDDFDVPDFHRSTELRSVFWVSERSISLWMDKIGDQFMFMRRNPKRWKSNQGKREQKKPDYKEQRQISDDEAYERYVAIHPLKYSVDEKFDRDHLLKAKNLSKKTSIEEAIERSERGGRIVVSSSWILATSGEIINKARSGLKRSNIFLREGREVQQMNMQISVNRRTVEMRQISPEETDLFASRVIKIRGQYLHVNCVSEEKEVKINVVGPWDPLTGEVKMYHYEAEGFPPDHKMVAKYRKWRCDKDGKPISPIAGA